MTANLLRLRELNSKQLWILIQASMLLPTTAMLLNIFGFNRIQRLFNRHIPMTEHHGLLDDATKTAYLIYGVANRLPIHTTCLVRALVLSYVLQSQHIHNEIIIGVRKTSDAPFSAHAWVQVEDTPLQQGENVVADYTRLFSTANLDSYELN